MSVELGDSYEAIYQRAMGDLALGNREQGREALQRIINRLVRLRSETIARKPELQEILVRVWSDLCDYYRLERRYDDAITLCNQVVAHLPGEHTAEIRITAMRILRGEVEEGLADLRQIAERDQSFSAWYALGVQYLALERYPEAITAWRTALAHAANNQTAAAANIRLFEAYRALEQVEDALSTWNVAVVLNPELVAHVQSVYRWLIERGDLEQAAKYLRRESNVMRRTFYQGVLDQLTGRESAARSQWRRVLDMDAHSEEADIAIWLEAALRLKEPERALKEVESLSEHGHPFSDRAHILVGIMHAMSDAPEDAREWFDRALQQMRKMGLPGDSLDGETRALFESLVTNPEIRQALASYWQE